MTNESAPTDVGSMSLDPVQASQSLAEFAAASEATAQRAATSLDVARHHAFTGEITFLIEPLVRVYLDGGVVYYAEIVGGQSMSELLLAAHVLDARQLEHGVVRVGDVEHLGRLFDRDDTVDRDAVMVAVEHHVDGLLNQLAERVVSSIAISAYRHHASGVHRWFVAPLDSAETPRPVSDVAQIDRSVVDDLPGLNPVTPAVHIEWTDSLTTDLSVSPSQPSPAEVQAELDRFDADVADWAAAAPAIESPAEPIELAAPELVAPIADEPTVAPLGDFHIVWPNGTQDPGLLPEEETTESLEASETPTISLDLTPAVVEELPAPGEAIPDDVAAAVKRALQAIDEASAQPIVIPAMELSPILLPQIDEQPALRPVEVAPVAAPVPTPDVPTAAPMGFAPPTADMSAEVMYQRQAAELAAQSQSELEESADAVAIAPVPDASSQPILPAPAAEQPAPAAEERRGALHRLIGSLRHSDNDND